METLSSTSSNAACDRRPTFQQVAPYPFTTLMPNLGVLAYDPANPTVMADLPGLIEGAHMGRGLGRAFLRHLRRTRALVVVVDASGQAPAQSRRPAAQLQPLKPRSRPPASRPAPHLCL